MKSKLLLITIVVVAAAALVGILLYTRGPVINSWEIVAGRIAEQLPGADPDSSLWNRVSEHPARLMVQDIAEPKLTEPGIDLVRVRALHDGNWVVFRLEWDDASRDVVPDTGSGSDAAAVQFPEVFGTEVPDAAMGEKGKGVRIWYWKAVWQDDQERARRGEGDRISALHPNSASDHYPYQANPAARAEMEKRYAPARAAGNPIAVGPVNSPVQVVMAEGFGNVSPAPVQEGTGRGIWSDGRWVVTIGRPLSPGERMDSLEPGKRSYAAIAVWDGAAGQTGSRKMRSGWIPLILE